MKYIPSWPLMCLWYLLPWSVTDIHHRQTDIFCNTLFHIDQYDISRCVHDKIHVVLNFFFIILTSTCTPKINYVRLNMYNLKPLRKGKGLKNRGAIITEGRDTDNFQVNIETVQNTSKDTNSPIQVKERDRWLPNVIGN